MERKGLFPTLLTESRRWVRDGREPMSEYLSEQRSGTRARRTVGNVGYARYSVRGVLALYEAVNVSLR